MAGTKKLVKAFLVLGAVVSLVVLSFSSFFQTAYIQPNNNAKAENGTFQYSQNAFISPGWLNGGLSPEERLLAEKELPAVKPSSNLTDNLAQNLAREVLIANPDGLKVGSNGQATINPPDADAIKKQLAADPELKNLKIPDWDKEAEALASQILISKTTAQSKDNYQAAIGQLINNYFTPDVYKLVDSNNVSITNLPTIKNSAEGALKTALQTETPENFYNLHKSFIKLLVYTKNLVTLAENSEEDPLKAVLIYQAEKSKYDSAVKGFSEELQKTSLVGFGAASKPNAVAAIIQQLLGTKTAYAMGWPVFDISVFFEMIKEEIINILLQILKNKIVMEFQNHVLKFIQNNGNARFIRNWALTLLNAYALGAGSAAQKLAPALCSSFGPLVTGNIMPSYGLSSAGLSYGSCPLEKLTGSNLNNFYGDFSQGGWLAYGASILPSSNYYGSLFSFANQLERAAVQAQDVEKTKSIANQGFKSGGQQPGQCGNPVTYTASYTEGDAQSQTDAINTITNNINYQVQNGGYMQVQPITCNNGTCSAALCPKSEVEAGQLAEDVNNPAQAIKTLLDRALGSNVDLTVNANSAEELLATVTGSFIDSILTNTLSSLINTSATPPPPPPNPQMPPTACNPPSQTVTIGQTATLSGVGGDGTNYIWSAPGGVPATGSGQIFSVTYYDLVPTTHTITVTSNNKSATCWVSTQ